MTLQLEQYMQTHGASLVADRAEQREQLAVDEEAQVRGLETEGVWRPDSDSHVRRTKRVRKPLHHPSRPAPSSV